MKNTDGIETLEIASIRRDGGTQMRDQSRCESTVAEYQAAMEDGANFPPIVVFFDGAHHWLADGFHRCFAADEAGLIDIEADVKQGTKRDAILYAVGANANHGLRRTNADKRRAVMTLLNDEEWAQWSDSEIARRSGVHQTTVGRIRADASPMQSIGMNLTDRTFVHPKTGKPTTMQTAGMGKKSVVQEVVNTATGEVIDPADLEVTKTTTGPMVAQDDAYEVVGEGGEWEEQHAGETRGSLSAAEVFSSRPAAPKQKKANAQQVQDSARKLLELVEVPETQWSPLEIAEQIACISSHPLLWRQK